MSPTRRDVLKHTLSIDVASSPAVIQAPSLSSMVDLTDRMPDLAGAVTGTVMLHWQTWSPAERKRRLDMFDQEFPDLTAEVIEYVTSPRKAA